MLNRKLILAAWVIGLFLLTGCATADKNKLNNLRNDHNEDHNLNAVLNYDKESVFNACLKAIPDKSNTKVWDSDITKGEIYAQSNFGKAFATGFLVPGGSGTNLAVFLEGSNPTKVRIVQMNYGFSDKDYKKAIFEGISSELLASK